MQPLQDLQKPCKTIMDPEKAPWKQCKTSAEPHKPHETSRVPHNTLQNLVEPLWNLIKPHETSVELSWNLTMPNKTSQNHYGTITEPHKGFW